MSHEVLESVVRAKIAELVTAHGMRWTARALGVAEHTGARLTGGLPVRAGTILAAARALGLLSLGTPPQPMAISSLPNAT